MEVFFECLFALALLCLSLAALTSEVTCTSRAAVRIGRGRHSRKQKCCMRRWLSKPHCSILPSNGLKITGWQLGRLSLKNGFCNHVVSKSVAWWSNTSAGGTHALCSRVGVVANPIVRWFFNKSFFLMKWLLPCATVAKAEVPMKTCFYQSHKSMTFTPAHKTNQEIWFCGLPSTRTFSCIRADDGMYIGQLLEPMLPNSIFDLCQVTCNGKLVPFTCRVSDLPSMCPVLRVMVNPLRGGVLEINTFEQAKRIIDAHQALFTACNQWDNLNTFCHLHLKAPARDDVNRWRKLASQWGLPRQKLADMKEQCLHRFLSLVRIQAEQIADESKQKRLQHTSQHLLLVKPGGNFNKKLLVPQTTVAKLLNQGLIEPVSIESAILNHYAWKAEVPNDMQWDSLLECPPESLQKARLETQNQKSTQRPPSQSEGSKLDSMSTTMQVKRNIEHDDKDDPIERPKKIPNSTADSSRKRKNRFDR